MGKGYDSYKDAIRKLAFTSGLQKHAAQAAGAPSGRVGIGFDPGQGQPLDPGHDAIPEQYSWIQFRPGPRLEGIGFDPGQDPNPPSPTESPRFNTKQELYDYLMGQSGDALTYESKEKYGRDLTEGQLQNMYARYASGNLVGAVPDWTYHREAYNTQNTPGLFTEAPKSGYRIAGEQALVGSTPVFGDDGKVVGYKINLSPDHINLADTSGRVQSSTNGATLFDTSLKDFAVPMGDGTAFVKAEDIGKLAYSSTGNSTYSKDPNFFDKYMPGLIQAAALGGTLAGLGGTFGAGATGGFGEVLGLGADALGSGISAGAGGVTGITAGAGGVTGITGSVAGLSGGTLAAASTGGLLVGSDGLLGSTGNAIGDQVLNSAGQNAITSAATGNDPLKGAVQGAVSGLIGASGVGSSVASGLGATGDAATAITSGVNAALGSGATTAINGGSFSDVLTNAATSGLAQGAGSYVGNSVDSGSAAIDRGLGGATAGGINAALTGGNIGTGILTGGAAGAAGGLATDLGASPAVAGAVQGVTGGLINSALQPDAVVNPPPAVTPATTTPTTTTPEVSSVSFGDVIPQFMDVSRSTEWGRRLIEAGRI